MNIVFIANHDLTYFYYEIARILEKKGVRIFWISPSPKLYKWLATKYNESDLLLIDYKNHQYQPIADLNLSELVFNDRVLKYEKYNGIQYLESIQMPIQNFIINNDIKFIFGEKTWAHEELIYRICVQSDKIFAKFLSPHTIRIPAGKFAFFEDPEMHNIYRSQKNQGNNNQESIKIETPDYLKKNDIILRNKNSISGLFRRFWKLISFQNADLGSPCRPKLWRTIVSRLQFFYNRFYYYKTPKNQFKDIHKPYVFLTLHYQPEASVDVMGRYYENQLLNIQNIWRKLPSDWLLVIKEHSNAVGCRGPRFFSRVLQLPNVILVEEKESSLKFLKNAEVTFSITGTIGLEAILEQKIAFLFGNPHFAGYGKCYNITLEDLKNSDNLIGLIKEKSNITQPTKNDLERLISENSYRGIISSPQFNSDCMTPENIRNVSNAFCHIMEL